MWASIRREFIATHRPRLRVSDFQLVGWDSHGQSLSVLFRAQNIGESAAHVFKVEGRILISPQRIALLEPAMTMPFRKPYAVKLVSGERDLFGINDGPVITEENATAIYAGETPVICVGRVIYRDDTGIQRETGFARQFAIRPHRLSERIDHPDYEYEY